MDDKHKGSLAELQACAFLLRKGYEVFRNISQHGIVDVIAVKDGRVFKFDIKYGGGKSMHYVTMEQSEQDVCIIVVMPDGTISIIDQPQVSGILRSIACAGCGKEFLSRRNARWCSDGCKRSLKNRVRRAAA